MATPSAASSFVGLDSDALVADGLSNREIANSLHLSERAVHGHVQSILRKLDLRSRAQVAVWFATWPG
ncbi:MAG: response regulator transcription factor [Marmoricola sp.]